ncbi:PstS family phosphate ABC transporter substrate-binding protein [bacterium]|nr:PstS family phosphate ABC transporter substrate-binding protein [bacterium]
MKNTFKAILLLSLVTVVAVGCDKPKDKPAGGDAGPTTSSAGGSGTGEVNDSLKGSVTVEGSSTVEPISIKAREEFNKQYTKVNVSVSGQGTGNGFKALANGECDFSDASRPVKAKEFKMCQDAGIKFVEVPVAYDGLTVVVNKDNKFIESLTVDQLKMIFREDMAAKTWKEVDASWPDKDITIYAPGIASGTHDYFVEVIGKKDGKGLRSDSQTTLSEDDKTLVTGVSQDEFSIAFFGYSYFEANKDVLRAIPIVNPSTEKAVTPSIETIESGEYAPFSRPLLIYINMESYGRLEVETFVDFYLENAAMLAKEARYVALPQSIYDMVRDNLDQGKTGTHFLDAEGEKRSGGLETVFKPENLRAE